MRILATLALLFQRFYFGPVGAGAGVFDGLILYSIWFNRERQYKESKTAKAIKEFLETPQE